MHEAKADIEPGCRRPRACLHVLIVDVRCVQLPPPTLHDCGAPKRKTIVTHQTGFCVSVRQKREKKGPLIPSCRRQVVCRRIYGIEFATMGLLLFRSLLPFSRGTGTG